MKFYIFPGLGENEQNYKWLIKEAEKKYSVIFFSLDFNKNSFMQLTNIVLDPDSVVFGFSIGALIAFKNISLVERGIYCSISNLLGKDTIGKENAISDIFNDKILKEFQNEEYGEPKARSYVVYCGEKEVDDTTKTFKNLEIIRNTGHILNAEYKNKILKNL